LMTPFGLAFLPDGRLLVTERDGRLRVIDRGKLLEPVSGVPKVHVQQDGGLLDVEVHPDYARNRWIYLAYSEDKPGTTAPPEAPPQQVPSMTVIVRGHINDKNEWTDQQLIYRAPAELYTTNGAHYGCRMIFDRQNHLFFSLGERGNQPNSQDLKTPLGLWESEHGPCLFRDCAVKRCAVSRSRGRPSSARKCSSISSAASATSCSRRTVISTLPFKTRRVYQIMRAVIFRFRHRPPDASSG